MYIYIYDYINIYIHKQNMWKIENIYELTRPTYTEKKFNKNEKSDQIAIVKWFLFLTMSLKFAEFV